MRKRFLFFCFISLFVYACNSNVKSKENTIGDRLLEESDKNEHDFIFVTGWYYVVEKEGGIPRQLNKTTDTIWLSSVPILTVKNMKQLELYESNTTPSFWGLSMSFDKEGTEKFRIATKEYQGKQLAFVLNDLLLSVSTVNSEITGGQSAINGGYSKDELAHFKKIIEEINVKQ